MLSVALMNGIFPLKIEQFSDYFLVPTPYLVAIVSASMVLVNFREEPHKRKNVIALLTALGMMLLLGYFAQILPH
jgi:hypothetical protein